MSRHDCNRHTAQVLRAPIASLLVDLVCRATMIGELPTLVVEGEIDIASVPLLSDALLRLLAQHVGLVVAVDLDAVTVLDDVGLGILLGAAGRARESDGDLVVVCTSPRLRERFERTRLSHAIEMRDRLGS